MTSSTCDAFCCCDTACDKVSVADWTKQKICKNITYENEVNNIYPLARCLDQQEAFNYNSYKGLYAYIDPFSKLTCVRINTNPLIGDYYNVNKDFLNDKQAESKIVDDP